MKKFKHIIVGKKEAAKPAPAEIKWNMIVNGEGTFVLCCNNTIVFLAYDDGKTKFWKEDIEKAGLTVDIRG